MLPLNWSKIISKSDDLLLFCFFMLLGGNRRSRDFPFFDHKTYSIHRFLT
uniref:Uncharacterized protein n=1 Tax=Ciona intestinalis TaxID=7719 RepID=H2XPQ2_CIOIN